MRPWWPPPSPEFWLTVALILALLAFRIVMLGMTAH